MVRRTCRDCPIEGCGSKYLVKLSNHLTQVHRLSEKERKPLLQQAKLQPKTVIRDDAITVPPLWVIPNYK